MRVLLVSAATPDTFWSYKHVLSFISKKACFPPLGLLTVAAMLPKRWDLKLVDLNVTSLTDAQLAWADYVFVSAMLAQAGSAREVIARCQSSWAKTVVAGGPLFTTGHAGFPEVQALRPRRGGGRYARARGRHDGWRPQGVLPLRKAARHPADAGTPVGT